MASKAFLILKEHSQATLDFSILVCTAVPQLTYAFQQQTIDPSTHIVPNDEFGTSATPYSTEKKTIADYKTVLGANILLTNFSFFESYFFSLVDEIMEFHGGAEQYIKFIEKKVSRATTLSIIDENNLKKLRVKFKGKDAFRYDKFTRLVGNDLIVWPSEKLALYGIKQIVNNRKRWKSVDIPNLITDLLVYDLDEKTISKYHKLRDDRNKIAHGKKLSYTLDKALVGNEFLYDLAKKIDSHVIKNFMIIERYR
jgi:hypothetical protein